MLEAMEERMVTSDGQCHKLPEPFIVVATQNPYDFEGTYPLPESQLDRFLMKISIGYPERASELEIMKQSVAQRAAAPAPTASDRFADCFDAVEQILVSPEIESLMMDLVRMTRSDHRLIRGVFHGEVSAVSSGSSLCVCSRPGICHSRRCLCACRSGACASGHPTHRWRALWRWGRIAIEDILRECMESD